MTTPLERLQNDFAAALVDARAAAAIVPALVASDARMVERIALYRGNITAAWEKALSNAYPVVRCLVGKEFFAALARAYGGSHSSTCGDLNEFGEQFSTFVRTFEHTQSLPYLFDVAALEWRVHRAHYAADADSMPRTRIATLTPEQLLGTQFRLRPGCAWIESRYPIASLWLAHQPSATVELPNRLDHPETALVVRSRWRVTVVESNAGEIAALEQLSRGADVDGAIDAATRLGAPFDLTRALVRWLDLGVLMNWPAAAQASSASAH
ncbi:MAG: DNA-binding domain-containing protein [Rudaea sp.]|nr:DNA-binding domain-containing protein [Rudaea sp.]